MKKILLLSLLFFTVVCTTFAQMSVINKSDHKLRIRIKNGLPCASVCESTANPGIGQIFGITPTITSIPVCSGPATILNAAIEVYNTSTSTWVAMPSVIGSPGCSYPGMASVFLTDCNCLIKADIMVFGSTSLVRVYR
jgi:hypothetical protein